MFSFTGEGLTVVPQDVHKGLDELLNDVLQRDYAFHVYILGCRSRSWPQDKRFPPGCRWDGRAVTPSLLHSLAYTPLIPPITANRLTAYAAPLDCW